MVVRRDDLRLRGWIALLLLFLLLLFRNGGDGRLP
jgi:hypothetical protein